MEKKRKYFGTVHLKKAYVGEKSVNLVVDKDEAIKLAKLVLTAVENGRDFDLAAYFTKKRKDGKINMTVTSSLR